MQGEQRGDEGRRGRERGGSGWEEGVAVRE